MNSLSLYLTIQLLLLTTAVAMIASEGPSNDPYKNFNTKILSRYSGEQNKVILAKMLIQAKGAPDDSKAEYGMYKIFEYDYTGKVVLEEVWKLGGRENQREKILKLCEITADKIGFVRGANGEFDWNQIGSDLGIGKESTL